MATDAPPAIPNAIDVAVPVQIDCDDGVAVATGVGLTVTVIVYAAPTHEFAVDVGVTIY